MVNLSRLEFSLNSFAPTPYQTCCKASTFACKEALNVCCPNAGDLRDTPICTCLLWESLKVLLNAPWPSLSGFISLSVLLGDVQHRSLAVIKPNQQFHRTQSDSKRFQILLGLLLVLHCKSNNPAQHFPNADYLKNAFFSSKQIEITLHLYRSFKKEERNQRLKQKYSKSTTKNEELVILNACLLWIWMSTWTGCTSWLEKKPGARSGSNRNPTGSILWEQAIPLYFSSSADLMRPNTKKWKETSCGGWPKHSKVGAVTHSKA